MREQEVIFTGIGGQGIQLMAKILAQAAADEGKHVMLFGVYGGAMRGSSSESTLVIAPGEIQAPPIVPQCWGVVAMHPQGLDVVARKLRPGGLMFANETLVPHRSRAEITCIGVPATRLAEEAKNIMGAGMIMLGAFATHTRLVGFASLVRAMRAALPPHRARMADANAALLQSGADFMQSGTESMAHSTVEASHS